jgi:membrane associated rhomboid family serine protease
MALLDDIKFQFRTGNILMQLIYVNSGIFLAMMVIRVVLHLFGQGGIYMEMERLLAVPASPMALLLRPWTLITHMFVHQGFFHVLFNMVWLYFGGQIFLTFLDSKKLLSTYVLGALGGAALFMLAFNLFPVYVGMAGSAYALGASAGVLAILVAAATMAPDFVVRLILIGPVRLKYIAMVAVALDVIFIPDGNAGGHFGHLGGAAFGFFYALQLKRGNDLTIDILRPWFWLKERMPKRKQRIKVVHSKPRSDHEFNEHKATRQEEVDAILDKIKQSGYESLSKREKEILFQASKEI